MYGVTAIAARGLGQLPFDVLNFGHRLQRCEQFLRRHDVCRRELHEARPRVPRVFEALRELARASVLAAGVGRAWPSRSQGDSGMLSVGRVRRGLHSSLAQVSE